MVALLVYGFAGYGDTLLTFLSLAPLAWLGLAMIGIIPFAQLLLALPLIVTNTAASPPVTLGMDATLGLKLGIAFFLQVVSLLVMAALCILILIAAVPASLEFLDIDAALHDTHFLVYPIAFTIAFGIILPVSATIGTAPLTETLGMAFRQSAGWANNQQNILERFE